MTKPIRPSDITAAKLKHIPDKVIEAFNELIAREFDDGEATIFQKDIVDLVVAKGIDLTELWKNKWLDVEPIYRKAGWIVEYDRPGYCETYEPSFTFRKRTR